MNVGKRMDSNNGTPINSRDLVCFQLNFSVDSRFIFFTYPPYWEMRNNPPPMIAMISVDKNRLPVKMYVAMNEKKLTNPSAAVHMPT